MDLRQQWEKFLEIVSDNLPAEQFNVWFRPVTPVSFVDGRLTIDVPTIYYVEHIEERYQRLVEATLRRVFGPGVQLFYRYNQLADRPDTAVDLRSEKQSYSVKPSPRPVAPAAGSDVPAEIDPQLNPRYTFDNYCCSDSNKLACSIGRAIAENPSCRTFNPLYVFGPSGVGKTHLIQAIGIAIKERQPQTRVLYVTARLFESQFTDSVRHGRVNDFIHFYQSIDVLIVDDIQDLASKLKTQNAFFHIFNHLVQNLKQLILSSDTAPAAMEGMEERLLSRFRQGMTAELFRPDYELRRSVLELKAQHDGLSLPTEVLDYIAANVTQSIRELEGVMVSLIAHATILGCEPDLTLAQSVVANAVKIKPRQVNFEMIVDAVATHYDISPDLIFTKTRRRQISDARQLLMYLAKKLTDMPLKAIGLRLDRTHATVLYACNQTEERLSYDRQLQADKEAIEAALLR